MKELILLMHFRLEKNFGHEDDYVIESLEKSMDELKKAKLDHPGAPPDSELPQKPFGKERESWICYMKGDDQNRELLQIIRFILVLFSYTVYSIPDFYLCILFYFPLSCHTMGGLGLW